MEEDDLEKIVKKSKDKWLKSNKAFKSKLKSKDDDSDKSGSDKSDKDSDDDSDKSDKDSDDSDKSDDEGDEDGENLKFDPKKSTKDKIKFTKSKTVATKTSGTTSWDATAVMKKANKFTIKILIGKDFMIGFVTNNYNISGNNYSSNGHFIHLYDGYVYGSGNKKTQTFNDNTDKVKCTFGASFYFYYLKKISFW